MIQRIRNYNKKEPSRDARKIYLICEGEHCEPEYFDFFRGLSSNISIIPIPSESGHANPVKLKTWVERHMLSDTADFNLRYMEKDAVWFVVDTDDWQRQGKIAVLKEFCNQQNKEVWDSHTESPTYPMWNIAQSNPMFEVWLYYHVYDERPIADDVSSFESFKEYVNNKISGGFNLSIHPAYIEEAIRNSQSLFSAEKDGSPSLFSTEVFRLAQIILPFVKKELDRLKAKISL